MCPEIDSNCPKASRTFELSRAFGSPKTLLRVSRMSREGTKWKLLSKTAGSYRARAYRFDGSADRSVIYFETWPRNPENARTWAREASERKDTLSHHQFTCSRRSRRLVVEKDARNLHARRRRRVASRERYNSISRSLWTLEKVGVELFDSTMHYLGEY